MLCLQRKCKEKANVLKVAVERWAWHADGMRLMERSCLDRNGRGGLEAVGLHCCCYWH